MRGEGDVGYCAVEFWVFFGGSVADYGQFWLEEGVFCEFLLFELLNALCCCGNVARVCRRVDPVVGFDEWRQEVFFHEGKGF